MSIYGQFSDYPFQLSLIASPCWTIIDFTTARQTENIPSLCGVSVSPSHFLVLFFRRERVHTTGSCTPTKHLQNDDPNTMHVPQLSLQLPLSILSPFIALLCSGIFTNLEQFLMGTLILFLQLNISTCESISQLLLLLNIISILWQCEACFDKNEICTSRSDIPDSHQVLHFIACGSISGCP